MSMQRSCWALFVGHFKALKYVLDISRHFNMSILNLYTYVHYKCLYIFWQSCYWLSWEIFTKKIYRSTFVGSAWLFVFFIPATTANDLRLRRIFYPSFYPLHLLSYLNSWERASIFPFECSVLKKGTTGTIFITSLVWRGPWLGIEPGTSRSRSQHYTTRLSRRQ